MRNAKISHLCALLCLSGLQSAYSATSFGRTYVHTFEKGNLIRNWSFESRGDNWHDEPMVMARFRAASDDIQAVTGSYVARFEGTNATGETTEHLVSERIPIEKNITYCLSLRVMKMSATTGLAPKVKFYESREGSSLGSANGGVYFTASGWRSQYFSFTPPSGANFVEVVFITLPPSQGGYLYFDDIVLEKGSTPSSRHTIQESLLLTDETGGAVQSFEKIEGSGDDPANMRYLLSASAIDERGRLDKAYAPYIHQGRADFDEAFSINSQNYNNGSLGPNGKGSLGAQPFVDFEYRDEPGFPVEYQKMPGTAWANRDIRSGWYFAPNTDPPSIDPEEYNPGGSEMPYRAEWSKDVEGRISISWFDMENQLIKSGSKVGGVWKFTHYEYFPNGSVKKVLTPLDAPGNEAAQEFREVTNINSAGEVTSSYTKDRGLVKYWRNRLGQIRFSRHESQASNEYDYVDYDVMDRPIASGIQQIPGFIAAMADERSTASESKTEHKGFIYDNLETFQTRTGFSLAEILPGKSVGLNGSGRVVCSFHFNKEVSLSALTAKDKFVATFYNYDTKGRLVESYKFIGPIRTASERIHRSAYVYDYLERLISISLYDDSPTPQQLSYQFYQYDSFDRIIRITGKNGKFIGRYEYYDWGGLKSVRLGGDDNTTTGTRIEFTYHGQGWLKEIKAIEQSSGHVAYQQALGYEGKALDHLNVTAPIQPKYDGSISQQISKFTSDLEALGSVRLTNYQYDDWNRLLIADARKNSGSALLADQTINLGSLQWAETEDKDSRLSYDDIGRIITNRSGVASPDQATYHYQTNTYKLDHITGKLNAQSGRDASSAGNFVYDARGRMIEDKSKKLNIRYGWDDMPVEFAMDLGDSLVSEFNFYDASGNRVSRVQTNTATFSLVPILLDGITFFVKAPKATSGYQAKIVASTHDVALLQMGDRRWTEIYSEGGAVIETKWRTGIFGRQGPIGDIVQAGSGENTRFFVKNHLGSTMLTVDNSGRYTGSDQSAYDYMAYGKYDGLKAGTMESVREKFSQKEYEEMTGLYAFGARWMDPEIGSFISPDPANQFFDPYSYTGGNPINRIDPDGRMAQGSNGGGVLQLPTRTVTGRSQGGGSGHRGGGGNHQIGRQGEMRTMTSSEAEGIFGITFDAESQEAGLLNPNALMKMLQFMEMMQAYQKLMALKEQSDRAKAYQERFIHDPSIYDANKLSPTGEYFTELQKHPDFQFSKNEGRLIGRAVAELPTMAAPIPVGLPLRLAGKGVVAITGRVATRINISNRGFAHTLANHFNPAKAKGKSQFTITEQELKGLLSAKSTVQSEVSKLSSGGFIRTVTAEKPVGVIAEKYGGGSTNVFSVITDRFGNLETAFPGKLY